MSTTPEQPRLTGKRRAFVSAYLGEAQFNASEAARIAGYAQPGPEGYRLLKNAEISQAIEHELSEAGLNRDMALALLRQDAMRSDLEVIGAAAIAPGRAAAAAMVSSLISARTTARTNLLKAHGLLSVNVKHSGRVDHVHRVPHGLHNLSDDELDALEAIALKAQDAEREVIA